MSRNTGLSLAQIEQVARRMNPPEGKLIVFSREGVVLHTDAEQTGTLNVHGEIYSARRVGDRLQTDRISPDES